LEKEDVCRLENINVRLQLGSLIYGYHTFEFCTTQGK